MPCGTGRTGTGRGSHPLRPGRAGAHSAIGPGPGRRRGPGPCAAFYETQDRGIRLVQLEESWQLVSAPRWGAVIRGLLARKKPDKLSASALETLALVAYFQPVTRVYLDQARGVDSAHSLGVLLDRELVEPCGTLLYIVGRNTAGH